MSQWQAFRREVSDIFHEEQLIEDEIRRFAYSTDASCYRLLPKLVIKLNTESELVKLIQAASQHGIPITFRTAGTSLSGQAITDSVLVMLTEHWTNYRIENNGDLIHLQPSIIGAEANRLLAPFQRKIGPDPASINACKLGGIIANNSSGMCCGTAQNSYHTLAGVRVVLADGTILDTRSVESVQAFRGSHSEFLNELTQLAETIQTNKQLLEKIKYKYRLKNTTGYSINALVDFTDPIDMLSHLLIGSEGTLGFVSEVALHTVPEHANKATNFVFFSTVEAASEAVIDLKKQPVDAVELLDYRSLLSVADKPGMPKLDQLGEDVAALLIETRAEDASTLTIQINAIENVLRNHQVIENLSFTTDLERINQLWDIRKGLIPALGTIRTVGTTVIIEDVAFPIEHLAVGVRDLQALFKQYGYDEGIILGHALEGNLHFVFSQGFDSPEEVQRYQYFMDDVCEMVAVKYQGSLKAEHGTGRNVAPYVELEWGSEAYQIMWQLKKLFDPNNVLNPGVILNKDPKVHVKHLKALPKANPIIDRCIECGFCEAVCPSRNLSFSPRQRIAMWREINRRKAIGEATEILEKEYQYLGVDTCAATGLCADRCPVNINTGDLIRQIRGSSNQKWHTVAAWTANHFKFTLNTARAGLQLMSFTQRVIGGERLQNITEKVHQYVKTPVWLPTTPKSPKLNQSAAIISSTHEQAVVYWPSCVSKAMGVVEDSSLPPLIQLIPSLLNRAGFNVLQLDDQQLCCGQPFASKGFAEVATNKQKELEQALLEVSANGRYPILADTSPCALKVRETDAFTLYEPIEFTLAKLNPHIRFQPVKQKIALHITCSTQRMGLVDKAVKLAEQCAEEVVMPKGITCCGFSGDKGFTQPDLNASSLASLAEQVADCDAGYSTSLTCEIGLSHHSGIPYRSLLYLVNEAMVQGNP
ncbi:FAD-binding and (Fe-S)-binding domain-containing protein [Spartinivicinus ruber]|uniref:FAD-binding and (Fe-S)-binding domain-containing protein n=1 Tax=Spartinivicinus ruber TaxID=2683272 RepID=UPI0013D52083|nr:FAD-binding and (Fe-S)-binding domain-containing protein [Spartinivicinus ruber]